MAALAALSDFFYHLWRLLFAPKTGCRHVLVNLSAHGQDVRVKLEAVRSIFTLANS